MTPFQAKYDKSYTLPQGKGTAKEKIAYLLNDTWIYSMNWPKVGSLWIDKAKEDLDVAMGIALDRLIALKEAKELLESIEEGE